MEIEQHAQMQNGEQLSSESLCNGIDKSERMISLLKEIFSSSTHGITELKTTTVISIILINFICLNITHKVVL
jgi:hypothetical protein